MNHNTKLQQAKWADFTGDNLVSFQGVQPVQMSHSYGTALPLLCDNAPEKPFGADLIRFEAGKGVQMHTHVGAHILLVTKGQGTLIYGTRHGADGPAYEHHPMFPGMIYLIPSGVPHAIEAETELVIIAIGNDHRPAGSPERLEVVNKSIS
jgi:quercetin dioxygenase-like cupin family protein